VAEVVGSAFGWAAGLISGPGALVAIGVAILVVLFIAVRSAFPKKVHRWCGGKGHWGVGPFRRTCGECSGSGLVDR
jgi:hypothetical protein